MRTYRVTSGPFKERPYFTDDEIELLCSDELRKVGLLPGSPEPIRIERFIEKRFGITPRYDDLPSGVLGLTKFGPNGVQEIIVSRTLSEEGTRVSERRLITTFAHEAGHGLLHTHLFVLGQGAGSLFGEDASQTDPMRILCREESVMVTHRPEQKNYSGRWWEFQANRAMSALLLPKELAALCLDEILVGRGTFGARVLPREHRERAVQLLTKVFEVNPIVARIRIETLYPAHAEAQLTL